MDKLISIIVPVYNAEKYLSKCVMSIIHQTYTNIELVLVDDGSTDNSGYLCDQWKIKDKRIRVVHKTNGGLSSARNTGLDNCNGDYIMFVDSDDYIKRDAVDFMYKLIINDDADIAVGNIIRVIPGGKEIYFSFPFNDYKIMSGIEASKLLLSHRIDCSSCNKIYKRTIVAEDRFPIGRFNEDIVFLSHIFPKSSRISFNNIPFYYYRETPGSLTTMGYNHKKYDIITNANEITINNNRLYPELEKYTLYFKANAYLDYEAILSLNKDNIDYKLYFGHILSEMRKMHKRVLVSDIITTGFKFKFSLFLINPQLYRLVNGCFIKLKDSKRSH